MLPCIVTDFLFNNQPDALIIQIFLFRVRMEQSSILTLLGSGHQKACMKLTSAEYTVENS